MSPLRPYLGSLPALGARVWIDPSAVVIGRVTIGDDASIWPGVVARGDVNFIEIGARTSIQDSSVLHVASAALVGGDGIPLRIGPDCTVGHRVILHACTVGARCLIGMGAIVMDGAVIGDEVIVGAGSLVPPGKKLPSRTLWLGCPARPARALTAAELETLTVSAAQYVRLKDDYLAGSSGSR
ncbi:MAG: gamma carbonic anhydrase family protein [Gammaproteobacteria bacterium]|nr:gamma carbonic anhydrase family protein [Gammaproteobacteria bacterium]